MTRNLHDKSLIQLTEDTESYLREAADILSQEDPSTRDYKLSLELEGRLENLHLMKTLIIDDKKST